MIERFVIVSWSSIFSADAKPSPEGKLCWGCSYQRIIISLCTGRNFGGRKLR
jgi:hypothetical protein